MAVVTITSDSQFPKILKWKGLVVVHLYADWAMQCSVMNGVLDEFSQQPEFKGIRFAKCIAEDLPATMLEYNVTAVPTFLLFRDGNVVDRVDGANPGQLMKKVTEHGHIPETTSIEAGEPKPEDLTTRLKKLINAAPVMLFMKGNAREPRCGFSKKIVEILDSLKAEYKTFDILSDEEVRQGLKTFSDWPTYPQLYIKGELIGGLDIVKELQESGELETMVQQKTEPSLDQRLKELTHQSDLMVFMKGERDDPKCGFSRQLMEILKQTGLPFETFDILKDEEVRQGLKTYSKWPTYPQIYVKGELVGGLDIIKELKESGELLATLKGETQ